MKNFLLGLVTCALLSFTAVKTEIITVKPENPKSVVITKSSSFYDESVIRKYYQQGYIFKAGIHRDGLTLIIMEKY